MDGWTQIDHVIRLRGSIVCLETKNYSGRILGGARQAQWTQALGKNTFKFQNPIFQNYKHVAAIEAIVDKRVPVRSLVVFVGAAKFPKGIPEGVCLLGDLKRSLQAMNDADTGRPVPEDVWQEVLRASSQKAADRRKHVRDLQRRFGGGERRRAGFALAGLGAVIGIINLLV